MIREALHFLAEQATKALSPQKMPDIPGEHETRVLINGNVFGYQHPVPAINAAVFDIPSMLTAIERYSSSADTATIWVRPDIVVIVLDGTNEDYRENCVRFTPGINRVVDVFARMQNQQYTHEELLNVLRFDLHGVTRDESFDLAVKNLKISTTTDENREQSRTSDAMGKSVRAEVSGQSQLPETVIFEFPAYPGLPELVDESLTVTCGVIPMPLEKRFKVAPLTGEIERIRRQAAQALLAAIRNTVPMATILIGNPNCSSTDR